MASKKLNKDYCKLDSEGYMFVYIKGDLIGCIAPTENRYGSICVHYMKSKGIMPSEWKYRKETMDLRYVCDGKEVIVPFAEVFNCPVFVKCVGDREPTPWENRHDAVRYFERGMAECGGSEAQRYSDIVTRLNEGAIVAVDDYFIKDEENVLFPKEYCTFEGAA